MSTRFRSWARRGLGVTVDDGGSVRPSVSVNGVRAEGPEVKILGPEAVVGLRDDVIGARYPPPGSRGSVPHYLASVTFRDADLPWRYRRGRVGARDRLRPWLALVVVVDGEEGGARYDALPFDPDVPGPAGVLTVPGEHVARDLPPLAESWAWAHVEGDDGASGRSRLLCPRRLAAETAWRACVVPATAGGARSALRGGTPEADDRDAWDVEEGSTVELPVYATWTFRTGRDEDFEALCRRLRPTHPGDVGTRTVGVAGVPGASQLSVVAAGVLRGEDVAVPDAPAALDDALATPRVADGADPVVGPPRWGAGLETTGARWADELHSNPAWRMIAGAGADAVRRNDQALVDGLWRAVGERAPARRLEDRARAIGAIGKRWSARLSGAPQETKMHVVAALLGRDPEVAADLARVGAPRGWLGPAAARRAAREVKLSDVPLINPMLAGPATVRASLRTTHAPQEPVTAIRAGDAFAGASEDADDADPPRVRPGPIGPEIRPGPLRLGLEDGVRVEPDGRLHRDDLIARSRPILADPIRPRIDPPTPPLLDLGPRAAKLLDVGSARMAKLEARLQRPPSEEIAPIRVDAALVDAFAVVAPELLIPGVDALGEDIITMLSARPQAVAAALVGANHELAREILWREIPIAPSDAWWRSFWAAGTEDLRLPADGDGLADLLGPGAVPLVLVIRGDLVKRFPDLRVRLVQGRRTAEGRTPRSRGALREPDFEGQLDDRTAWFGFRGLSEAEVRDEGGGWYVVLEESRTALRFGLEPDELAGDAPATWDDVSWGDLRPRDWSAAPQLTLDAAPSRLRALAPSWNASAAAMAALLARRPFRVLIHGSVLLTPGDGA